ncbi:MAG: helix-turn-helix domain-containing protein [Candidatus Buchananbacteria bacterium]
MLEQLFSSKTRVKLLRLFLNNPAQPFYLRELARKLGTQLNSVRREIDNLESVGIIKSINLEETEQSTKGGKEKAGSKKYFLADTDFILYPELKALLLKAQLLLEKNFVSKIEKLSQLKLFILTGIFVGLEGSQTDLLLVGMINRKTLAKIVRDFEREIGRSVNYTAMSYQEFKYRQDITDKFLYDILEGRKIVVVDKTAKAS